MKMREIKKRCNTYLKKAMFRLWWEAMHPNRRHKFDSRFDEWYSGGWVTAEDMQKAAGTSGMRRLRDLRDQGIPIEKKPHTYKTLEWDDEKQTMKQTKRSIYLYRLDFDPKEFDWKEFLKKGSKYIFTPKSEKEKKQQKQPVESP